MVEATVAKQRYQMTVGLPETDQRGHARKQYRGVQEQGTAWRQQQAIEAGHAVPRVVANVDHVAKPYPVVRCPDHAARHDSWGHEPNPARQFLAVAVRFEDKPEDDRYHRQQELVPDEPPRAQEPASQNQHARPVQSRPDPRGVGGRHEAERGEGCVEPELGVGPQQCAEPERKCSEERCQPALGQAPGEQKGQDHASGGGDDTSQRDGGLRDHVGLVQSRPDDPFGQPTHEVKRDAVDSVRDPLLGVVPPIHPSVSLRT